MPSCPKKRKKDEEDEDATTCDEHWLSAERRGREAVLDMRTRLLQWYDSHQRELPWRSLARDESADDDVRAYAVWVSEVMLQQTQVATVIDYYNRWMRLWPDAKSLSQASIDDVNRVWSGLGYYSRARRLWEGAQKVTSELNGRLPRDAPSLRRELPGVGRYTAAAVASIGFGEREAVVDGNVARVVSRVAAIGVDTTDKVMQEHLWTCAGDLLDPDRPGDFNQAVMELGATVCTPRNPSCSSCPLSSHCAALSLSRRMKDENSKRLANVDDNAGKKKKGAKVKDIEEAAKTCKWCLPESDRSSTADPKDLVTLYPRKAPKKAKREEAALVCVVSRTRHKNNKNKEYLMRKRAKDAGLLAGLLEFATFALESQDFDVDESYVRSRLSSLPDLGKISAVRPAGDVVHVFSHIRQKYIVWRVEVGGGVKKEEEGQGSDEDAGDVWLTAEEFSGAAVSTAMRKVFACYNNDLKTRAEKTGGKNRSPASSSKGQKSIKSFFAVKT